jgi:hypothetical protein
MYGPHPIDWNMSTLIELSLEQLSSVSTINDISQPSGGLGKFLVSITFCENEQYEIKLKSNININFLVNISKYFIKIELCNLNQFKKYIRIYKFIFQ